MNKYQESLDKLAILLAHYGYTKPMSEFEILQELINNYGMILDCIDACEGSIECQGVKEFDECKAYKVLKEIVYYGK